MSNDSYTIDPSTTSLLVLDYQVGTLSRVDNGESLLEVASSVIDAVRQWGGYVSYVRMAFEDADYLKVPPYTLRAARIRHRENALDAEASTTQIHEKVAPRPGDIVVRKTRVGAFLTTDLDQQLRSRGVKTLLVAGVTTSAVVLATVIDAADRDYLVYVVADACGENKPGVHDYLLEHILPRHAHVITSANVDDLLAAPTS